MHTGAYMASASDGFAEQDTARRRSSRHSRQIVHDALDVALGARPHLEAREMRLEVHRQRRAQIVEAGMHLAGRRRGSGRAPPRSLGSRPASGLISARYSAMASVSQP